MKLTKTKLQRIIKEETQILFKEDRQKHISGIKAKIGRLEVEVDRVEDAIEKRENEVANLPDYPEKKYELQDLRSTPEYREMTNRRNQMQEKIQELESQLGELSGESLEEKKMDIKKMNLKKGRCTPMGTPECPEGSPQYNLAKRFKSGDIHKDNLKKGKNPHGPG